MNPELLLLAVGALLLVTGLLGGGFELRELKIPKVGRVARVLATGAGVLCIVLGIGMTSVAEPTPPPDPVDTPVRFTISDSLGPTQISEQVTVILDGRRVGDLTVNLDYPETELEVSVPEPGQHHYTVAVSSIELAEDGSMVELTGTGHGTVLV